MQTARRGFLGASAVAGLALASGGARADSAAGDDAIRVASANPVIATTYGRVRGFRTGRIQAFLGIPYGAPVNGVGRFQPPRPPKPWEGAFDALAFGPQVPYMPPAFDPVGARPAPEDAFLLYRGWTPHNASEDCLRLNIWSPADRRGLPVMVYMHGGGLAAGSGNDLLAYSGQNLADRGDVVVVTHNHRLNLFGYLDLSSFGGRWANSSNLGMLDIVAVLQWVRDNIAAFGGDPANVTLFGQSGGGAKVSALMAMPAARGLFHKAIVQSGSPRMMGSNTPEQARATADKVLARLGLDASSLDQLAAMPAEKLAVANTVVGFGWKLSVGHPSLPIEPGSPKAAAQPVPLLVGTNLNEFVNAVDNPRARDFAEADLLRETGKLFGAQGPAIAAAYRRSWPNRTPFELFGAIQAAGVRSAALQQAAANQAVTGNAWHYLFAWRTPVLGGTPGTFHSAEIAFVFNNAGLCVNQTGGGEEAVALAHRMSDAWVAFARTGKPVHPGLPAWPTVGSNDATMVFDDRCHVVTELEKPGRELIAAAQTASKAE